MANASQSLRRLFQAASVLTGSPASSDTRATDLKTILHRRLSDYYQVSGISGPHVETTLEAVQLQTGLEALSIIERLHSILISPEEDNTAASGSTSELTLDPSVIGSRDFALVRTLLSITLKWTTEPLLQRVVAGIPSTSGAYVLKGASIIDLTGLPQDFSTLSSVTSRLLALPLSNGPNSPLSQSALSATLLNSHLPDLLLPCIVVGWLPKSLASESMVPVDSIRQKVMYLLSRLPASHVISAVGQTLSRAPPSLPYARRTCIFVLGRQLLRPEGIRGLCESVFAEEDFSGEDATLDKLEHVARVLSTVPSGLKAEDFCETMVPRMLLLLNVDDGTLPPIHRRAIAFSLSRMLTQDENTAVRNSASYHVLTMLHKPFLFGNGEVTPSASLRIIQVLLTNTDPSPYLISTLFNPIVPSLYALYSYLEGSKTSDPILRESIKGFLETWGRLVGTDEVLTTLWSIIEGEGGTWHMDVTGKITKNEDSVQESESLSLFTPESLQQAENDGELDADSNIFGLKPDPTQMVRFIKSMNRADVSSALFVRLLEGYRESQTQPDADPMKTLLYLQLVLQMQKQLSSDDTSNVLKKPEHILAFIKHALESRHQQAESRREQPDTALRMADLRIVPDESEHDIEDGDSDDEEPDSGVADTVDDMTTTAVKLLLAVLEANPDLSARAAPVLNDIFSLLEPLSTAPGEDLRSLAREARMVMTARLASAFDAAGKKSSTSSSGASETSQETYQKALKLLQDPLLPVRAHGLMLLRQLVSARRTSLDALTEPALDRALIPGILSIFMQSIQDEDSYMFLNAVQGLSAMVDGYGKDVLRGLVKTYADGLDGLSASAMSQHDVDMRTRVGEALAQVIRRCGETLPSYASLLVPPLFQVVRASHFPTVLRTSAISLLAQCVNTNALAVLPYMADLADAMVDLLQVESVSATPRTSAPRSDTSTEANRESEEVEAESELPKSQATMDSYPTSTNSKYPPLRRAALHFLTLLVRACTVRVYETRSAEAFLLPPAIMQRANTTLGYLAATDADDVVRVMARETAEGLNELAEAVIDL